MCAHRVKDKFTGNGKAIPLQAWTGPEVSRRLRLQDIKTMRQEDDKVFSPTHRPPLPPPPHGSIPGEWFGIFNKQLNSAKLYLSCTRFHAYSMNRNCVLENLHWKVKKKKQASSIYDSTYA
jgi:hypothetical protein